MISRKIFAPDGSNMRFLSDFIIRSEQFTRVYNYVYNAGGVDGDVDPTTGLFIRVGDFPSSEDIVTIDKWDLVDNSISFYIAPQAGSRVYIEVATTPEEFGSTLVQPSIEKAEEAALEAQRQAWNSEAEKMTADSYATEPENVLVKLYTSNNDGTFSNTNSTDYSALHWAAMAISGGEEAGQLEVWKAEAAQLTADSYATEPEDVFVNTFTSDGDGTFTATPTTDYSSLHWAAKSSSDSIPAPDFPADEGLALVARAAGNDWEKILGLPLETGNANNTVSNKGVEGDSYWSPFVYSPQTITTNHTLNTNGNATIVSPTINDGVTITVPDGAILVIL